MCILVGAAKHRFEISGNILKYNENATKYVGIQQEYSRIHQNTIRVSYSLVTTRQVTFSGFSDYYNVGDDGGIIHSRLHLTTHLLTGFHLLLTCLLRHLCLPLPFAGGFIDGGGDGGGALLGVAGGGALRLRGDGGGDLGTFGLRLLDGHLFHRGGILCLGLSVRIDHGSLVLGTDHGHVYERMCI